MANNTTLSAGTADGAVIATDDIGGVHYQYVKTGIGADDTFTILVGGSGNVAAGVQRVVIATDQPQLTNKLLVTPDLPSGASTAAKQPALGSAGSASADVLSIQGIASMTPVQVSDGGSSLTVDGAVTANAGTNLNTSALALESGGNLATLAALSRAEDAAHSSGHTGVMALAVRAATVGDLSAGNTDGDYEPLQVSAAGRLWVSATIDAALPAGTNGIGKLTANSGVTIGAVEIAAAQTLGTVTSLTQMNGQAIAMGTGTRSAGTQRVTIATDDVVPASQSGTWTVQPGNTPNTSAWLTQPVAGTGGGATPFYNLDVDESEDAIKAGAGTLYSLTLINTTNAMLYCKLYNATVANVTVGSTTPVATIPVPGNNDTDGAGVAVNIGPVGWKFDTAITIAATTAAADADTGAPSSGALIAVGGYL